MSLGNKLNYTNKNIQYLRSIPIVEYDLKSAGLSAIAEKGLLPEDRINALKTMNKETRNITIGHIMKRNKNFIKEINQGMIDARNMFMDANELTEDDILSIKRDAIFVINKNIKQTVFGNYNFVEQKTYTSYALVNRKEFYYSSRSEELDVKGISDSVRASQEEYFLSDIKNILRSAERLNDVQFFRFMKNYRSNYLNMRLPIETYRNLDTGTFIIGKNFELENPPGEELVGDMDYMYNYINYIIPLIQMLI